LGDLVRECMVLVFFESSCPYCDAMGPAWAESERVAVGDRDFPVLWIGINPEDTGAEAFIARFRLPRPFYLLADLKQHRAAGIVAWPLVYAVNQEAELLQSLSTRRAELESSHVECSTTE
jgi:thiol-disulfide isomerase/thioredoxin